MLVTFPDCRVSGDWAPSPLISWEVLRQGSLMYLGGHVELQLQEEVQSVSLANWKVFLFFFLSQGLL